VAGAQIPVGRGGDFYDRLLKQLFSYMLAFAVADYTGQAWLQSFNDSAETIMGINANDLHNYRVGLVLS
jgi:hypothetical protein